MTEWKKDPSVTVHFSNRWVHVWSNRMKWGPKYGPRIYWNIKCAAWYWGLFTFCVIFREASQ